jgi:hypothetical protein
LAQPNRYQCHSCLRNKYAVNWPFLFKFIAKKASQRAIALTRSVMGLKKRRLSRSGAAKHAMNATKDQQLGRPCTER